MNKLGVRPISTQPISIAKPKNQVFNVTGKGFKQHFDQAVKSTNCELDISKHAQLRMTQRNIDIGSSTWSKIETQINQAKKMGITDALVLTEQVALVISAKNNMVITAMERKEASSQIFTNINGTIIIE